MDPYMRKSTYPCLTLLISTLFVFHLTAVSSIGVNYGTLGNNLQSPTQVVKFLKTQTKINRVKIFDMNQDIIRAFANSGIRLSVTIPNGDIPTLADPSAAQKWVESNIRPFHPQTRFQYILVGTEVLHWGDQNMVNNLVPAMKSIHDSLVHIGLNDIKVTTPHSLGILNSSVPPSSASFRFGWQQYFLSPMLAFHRSTKSPFMVNPYPYFSWSPDQNNFALFRPNAGVLDPATGKNYTNVYDLLLDAVYTSMKKLGYGDVEIAVGETGWPSAGDPGMWHCTVENARWHNLNVLRKAESGVGTPLMPRRKFETYIFALFNENLKTGSTDEKNFGLFRPDLSAVYDIGIMRAAQSGGGGAMPAPVTPTSGRQWCVPNTGASNAALQANINWACTAGGTDCRPIQAGGACFNPNTVSSHAAYVMNTYFQARSHQEFNCDFSGTGVVTTSDPSYGACKYLA